MRPPVVSIIVLNYNSWEETTRCLGSIFRNEYPNYRAIVCDNNSSDESLEHVKAWAEGQLDTGVLVDDPAGSPYVPAVDGPIPYVEYDSRAYAEGERGAVQNEDRLVLLQTGENLGYGAGNNVGLKYAFRSNPATYALVLNNDVAIPRNFLTRAMQAVLSGPAQDADVVGFPMYFYEDPGCLQCAYLRDRFTGGSDLVRELPKPGDEQGLDDAMAHGAALLITPNAPVKVFPEEYFLYYEDSDYSKQVRRRGGSIFFQLDNPVYHRPSRSVGWGSPVQIYYSRRSKLAYCRKYNTPAEYGVVIVRMLYSSLRGCLKSLVRGERVAAKAYMLSFWHHLRGKKGRTWT
jgi:GT2 family glycosyltransferase